MRIKLFPIFLLLFVACEDKTDSNSTISRDANNSSTEAGLLLQDASVPDVRIIRSWDAASRIVDAEIDAAQPQVCERAGLREVCPIDGLLGPCANGEKICNLTSWSECHPINFPRIEICDELDNDCDGQLNESPNGLDENQATPQSPILSISCYTGPLGSSKEGTCAPGISVCIEMRRDTDAGIEIYHEYGT